MGASVSLRLSSSTQNGIEPVEAAYMHGTQIEKRRKLMQDWADYVDLPQAHGENIIPLKSANG